jgi:HEPN domain-containing protein
MLTRTDLRRIAEMRLRDAEVLFRGKRYDGTVSLCGYAVEISIKARICVTLRWAGFPEKGKEFENLQSFKTHGLNTLLHLSGREKVIRGKYGTDWSVVEKWDPESRYRIPGTVTRADARSMLESARKLMVVL